MYQRRDARGPAIADPNLVLFSNKHQSYEISHPIQGADRSTVLLISTAALLEIASRYDPAVVDRPDRPFPRSSMPAPPQFQLFQHGLVNAAAAQDAADPLALGEMLLALLDGLLARYYSRPPASNQRRLPGTAAEHAELVRKVKTLLNDRLHEQLYLDQIASAVFYSPYQLIRIFKRQTGLSVHQYRQRLRLLHAAERMADQPGENLDRIALELGFANHSHLTSAFTKTFGLSPSAFRRLATNRQLQQMRNFLKV